MEVGKRYTKWKVVNGSTALGLISAPCSKRTTHSVLILAVFALFYSTGSWLLVTSFKDLYFRPVLQIPYQL
jgi:hypothetical protein